MGNSPEQPIISYQIQKLEDQSLHGVNEYDKVGPFKFAASMALKIFKVPIALVVFYDPEGVDMLNEADDKIKAIRLNSMAMVKGAFSYENGEEGIFLLANQLVANGFGFRFFAATPLITLEGHHIGNISIMDKEIRDFEDSDKTIFFNLAAFVVAETRRRKLLEL